VFNFFLAKKKIHNIVQWDNRIKVSYEHEDFFIATKEAGIKIVYTPDAVVLHHPSFVEQPDGDYYDYRYRRQDRGYFFRKWGLKQFIDMNGGEDKFPVNEMVTVVIPCWGEYSKYAEECVNSVKSQTYPNVEILIITTETDLPSARNEGIARAKGKWILCLDVDDKIEPTFIEKTIGLNDIVTTLHKDFDGVISECSGRFTEEDFKKENRIIAGSLFRKVVWVRIGGYDELLKTGYEDYDFWLRAVRAGFGISVVEEPLYWYRQHNDSMKFQHQNKHKEIKEYILSKCLPQ